LAPAFRARSASTNALIGERSVIAVVALIRQQSVSADWSADELSGKARILALT